MRFAPLGVAAALCLSFSLVPAMAVETVALPTDRQALSDLNIAHAREVRRAERVCSAGHAYGFSRGNSRHGCVVGEVERSVRAHDNAVMLTFHQSLPRRFRYNAQRGEEALRYVK